MELYFYKLNPSSNAYPYSEDVTKNCRLTVNEIDNNFLNLQDKDINSIAFDCEAKTITLIRNNGEKLQAAMSCAWSGLASNFDVAFDDNGDADSGTLKFSWDEDGKHHEKIIEGVVTSQINTDGTLIGNGKKGNLLRLNPVEETGHYKPVKDFIDLTKGGVLPDGTSYGERHLTKEVIDDYGYLYNIAGLQEVVKKAEADGWRVATKADWDSMLDAIEPCNYTPANKSHYSLDCHTELGYIASKLLRVSENRNCNCSSSDTFVDYTTDTDIPKTKDENTDGIDKYGFSIFLTGYSYKKSRGIEEFDETASFWTSGGTINPTGNWYEKAFHNNSNKVYQSAECPFDFRSIRLVKDYDGSNFRGSSFIGGKNFSEVLMPSSDCESGYKIWTKTNINIDVTTDNYINLANYTDGRCDRDPHIVYVINDWDGEKWNRKIISEGSIVVINDKVDNEHDIDTEYCIVGNDLKATNDIKLSQIQSAIDAIKNWIDGINRGYDNKFANIDKSITSLSGNISDETVNREEADNVIKEAISGVSSAITDEATARKETDNTIFGKIEELSGKLFNETDERKAADSAITDNFNVISGTIGSINETVKKISADTETKIEKYSAKIHKGGTYTMTVNNGGILVIPSNDGSNDIFVHFDGNFGEIQ